MKVILFIVLLVDVIFVNSDDCLFTDTNGFWCRCDGPLQTCQVANVHYDSCGHNTKASTQVLLDQCVQSKLDPLHVAYQNTCTEDGDIIKVWYTTLDCHGEPTSNLKLSTNIAPCARIECSHSHFIKPIWISLIFTLIMLLLSIL